MAADASARLAVRSTLRLAALAAALSVSGRWLRRLRHAARLARCSEPFNTNPTGSCASLLIVGDSTALGTGASMPEATLAGRIARRYPQLAVRTEARAGARFEAIAEQLLDAGQHDLILIAGGANDVMRLTPRRRLAQAINLTLERAAQQARHVIVVPAPNVGNAPFVPPPLSWLLSQRSRALHGAVRKSAAAVGAAYVDLYRDRDADPFARDPRRLIAGDHLHPSDAGYAVWFDEIERQAPLSVLLADSMAPQAAWPGDL
jgi:lysophospholipase L1-like esterase